MPHCFAPIIDSNTKILILGTLPGPESLRMNEYYANKNNKFWTIISSIYNIPSECSYKEKCEILLGKGIGIWDVLKSAERDGALDNNIRSPIPNDFEIFLSCYPKITGIIFNGKESEKNFKRNFTKLYNNIKHERVFSSSPTCAKTFNLKLANWQNAIKNIIDEK